MSTLIGFIRALCLSSLVWGFIPAAHAAAPTQPTIVVLGDSLSAGYGIRIQEGWVSLLAKRLRKEGYGYRVVNASVSGETTQGGLSRLPRTLETHKPVILIVELGGNDGLRGLPLAASRENLAHIIEGARAAKAKVLLIGMKIPPNYGPRYEQQFQDMFTSLAAKYPVAFVPFLLDQVALRPDWMQADGIHANALGQPQMLDNVWPKLKALLVAPRQPAG